MCCNLGFGAFHRAHQAFTNEMLSKTNTDWGGL
ncbi:hypothetical protein OH492_12130 [Vibrio chagasii]|nr:hypothetical protein [Vibrio chagasii]